MHALGAPLAHRDVALLREHSLIGEAEARLLLSVPQEEVTARTALDRYVLTTEMYLERCKKAGIKHRGELRAEHWRCDDPSEVTPEYAEFISSHFVRFCDLKEYKPFWAFVTQVERWLDEDLPDLEALDDVEFEAHCDKEFERMLENPFYGVCRYVWYKQSLRDGGSERRYKPTLAMYFLAYLICDGRSAYIGKGRQITSTTTIAAIVIIMMITRRNFHGKLIACDLDTTTEIFEDKVKYAFGSIAPWMKPVVNNDKDNLFRVVFNRSAAKGSRKSSSSKISIVAPKLSAINGGAPQITLVDEAPFIDFFDGMVREGSPTLDASIDGTMKRVNQLVAWGTGGRSAKGGGSFEKEHRRMFNAWKNGDYSASTVPVFLDWTCRPGITPEEYERKYKAALSGVEDGFSQNDIERLIIQFKQFYPSSIDDMYSVGDNTLLGPGFIMRNQEKITALPLHMRPQYGHFEPMYDKSRKTEPGSFFGHPILDVQWVPSPEGVIDSCLMFMRPYTNYEWRYIQATDPIVSDEGYSFHASAIWDRWFKTVPCIVNMRASDPYISYTQSKLMGMYYRNHGQMFCPEIVENNIGKAYIKWLQGPEWRATRSLVTNYQLPDFMQGGGEAIGYDSKAGRKWQLVEFGKQQTLANGDNIFIPEFWSQHRTFVSSTSKQGTVSYSVSDRKAHKDDVIDAVFMAMGGSLGFAAYPVVEVQSDGTRKGGPQRRVRHLLQFDHQTKTLVRRPDFIKPDTTWRPPQQ